MKKVVSIALVLLMAIELMACGKPTKLMKCEVCGKENQCYQVTWHMIQEKTKKESHWCCSKDCEKYLDQLMTMGGAVKE